METDSPDATPRARALPWLFGPRWNGPGHLAARWLFLRALGLVFASAFYSLAFQIHGLIGPRGVLPAGTYLERVARALPPLARVWYAPTLLWLDASDRGLTLLVVVGMLASVLLVLNVLPRAATAVAWIAFLSFIGAAQDFAAYQSDGMLLEAGFLALFFAPPGVRPRLGEAHPPSRAGLFLLQWEWFRIYFESGVVKLASGDTSWRDMTAMDHYYENGPLPTWLGYYAQHLGHGFHAATAALTLVVELGLVWLLFLGRPARLACCVLVTLLQIGIIATANYAFLNYLVLSLGVLLLDDAQLARVTRWLQRSTRGVSGVPPITPPSWKLLVVGAPLAWVFYATLASFLLAGTPAPLAWILWPEQVLEPFRVANRYGLFAVMTPARYEIEFQGTRDGTSWIPYPFRYKPQTLDAAPGIYAPYQPRFEWNLWFASLGSCRDNLWVHATEARLLENDAAVLSLFADNPFKNAPPQAVRAVASQYWFTDLATKKATGRWWRRDDIGLYCPAVTRGAPR